MSSRFRNQWFKYPRQSLQLRNTPRLSLPSTQNVQSSTSSCGAHRADSFVSEFTPGAGSVSVS